MDQFVLGEVMRREIPTADGFCNEHFLIRADYIEVSIMVNQQSIGRVQGVIPRVMRLQYHFRFAYAHHKVRHPSHAELARSTERQVQHLMRNKATANGYIELLHCFTQIGVWHFLIYADP